MATKLCQTSMYFNSIILIAMQCIASSFNVISRYRRCNTKVQMPAIRHFAFKLKKGELVADQQEVQPFNAFPFALKEVITLTVDDLTNLGLGVGRSKLSDGSNWVIMVPLVLPGEQVKVQIIHNYKSYSEATLLEVIKASPDRVIPNCPYFSTCGGCQYQHMNVSSQRKWKKSQVRTALHRIAGLNGTDVGETIGTDHVYHYRSKITPHFATSDTVGGVGVIGFQQRHTRNLVDIKTCKVASEAVNREYYQVRETLLQSSGATSSNHNNADKSLLLRESSDGRVVTSPTGEVEQVVGDIRFRFQAREFFQNNPYVVGLLVQHVVDQAVGHGCKYLVDAYCGSGLFALSAARHFQAVYGIEISAPSVESAKSNAVFNEIDNVHFIKGDANMIFANLKQVPAENAVVVIDPPRKGCDASFLKQLFSYRPHKIVYISCEPTTQARDAGRIVAEGYEVVNVTPFDMFPQTRHIENVVTFVKK